VDPAERSPLWISDFKKSDWKKQKERGNADENPSEKRFARWKWRRPILPAEPKKIEGEKGNEPPIVVLLIDRPFAAQAPAKHQPKQGKKDDRADRPESIKPSRERGGLRSCENRCQLARSYSHSRIAKTRLRWELVEKIGGERESAQNYPSQQILGISFFDGEVDEAIEVMLERGGFLVAPSGTCFARLREDESYRRAILAANLAIADSGLMVLMWRLLRHQKILRVSGLRYLRQLLAKLKREGITEIFWVLPGERARQKLLDWSRREGFVIKIGNCPVAPQYGLEIEDRHLIAMIEQNRPAHIIIAIGSGAQEKLGYYLHENLSYRPATHCTGAALGFVTGEQIAIPDWADRFFLGWVFRLVAQPQIFTRRLSRAFELPWLIWKYGKNLPPIRQ
jgi:N-acetylglucosaminyldiphosphoundecaprenol N-acetyl-beta-D-mannosaminyltransferase